MLRSLLISATLLLASPCVLSDESEAEATDDTRETEVTGDGIERPKAMSGMSILGNEEAPKSLVIIPWKSSRLGDDTTLSDSLDDLARPVDKEVFMRELRFHEILSTSHDE
jgi:hypothetical protein